VRLFPLIRDPESDLDQSTWFGQMKPSRHHHIFISSRVEEFETSRETEWADKGRGFGAQSPPLRHRTSFGAAL
jgi:hypothetical protein